MVVVLSKVQTFGAPCWTTHVTDVIIYILIKFLALSIPSPSPPRSPFRLLT